MESTARLPKIFSEREPRKQALSKVLKATKAAIFLAVQETVDE